MIHRHHKKIQHGSLLALTLSGILLLSSLLSGLQYRTEPVHATAVAFSLQNTWNKRLPGSTALHPNSQSYVQDVVSQVSHYGAGTRADGPVFYKAPNNALTYRVTPIDCGNGIKSGLAGQWQDVPIDPSMTAGSNGRLLLFQAQTQGLWEFEGLQYDGSEWRACDGGRIQSVADSNGVHPLPYGLTASGASFAAGQISRTDFDSGTIDHAIGLQLPSIGGSASWPANRGGSGGLLPMGQRLRIDPSVDLGALSLGSFERMVAVAAQKYGLIVWDSAAAPGFTLESGISNQSLSNFPWDKLVALPADFGRDPIVPSLSSFSQSAQTVASGQTVTLTWQAINVDSCAVPPYASGLPTTGSWQSPALTGSVGLTLVCGGIAGSISRAAEVRVDQTYPTIALPVLADGQVLALVPVSGLVSVLPELLTKEAAETIQKVEYFERDILVESVTKPPFQLDSTKLPDGPHILDMKIFYRDGHTEQQRRTVTIANSTQSLLFAPPAAPSRMPRTLAIAAAITALAGVMGLAVHRGLLLARID